MSIVYGPVPSRRLGQSLGVDPTPFKTCNYSCVYCQLGRTTSLTNIRQDFLPPQEILAELREALDAGGPGKIDYISFVGQGEPLLCASLGYLIRSAKEMAEIPVALITNGSLLFMPDVREEVRAADVVIPSLDAADERTFHKLNRPWPKLRIAEIIEGLVAFRAIYEGQLWVEVMLVKDVNDSVEVLSHIAHALKRIRPDRVHINIPIRPPAEDWAEPPDSDGIIRAAAILGGAAPIDMPAEGDFQISDRLPVVDAIVEVLRRHPMREANLIETLGQKGIRPEEIESILLELKRSEKARRHIYLGQCFWEYSGGRFGSTAESLASSDRV